ncbi:MAG: RNA polymerase sigma factor SigZ [Deltaproteobacteria bacterium]
MAETINGRNIIMENTPETAQVWEEFSGNIRSHLLRKLRRKDDADDLMQEIFIKIHTHIECLRDKKKLTSWIYTIVENTLNDYYRKNRYDSEFDESRAATKDSAEENPLPCITQCLNVFIDRLPMKYREPLMLSDLEGKKQKEIARRMGLSYSGLKSRVQRGRRMIKDMFIECCKLSFDEKGVINKEYQGMENCKICGGA